MYLKQSIPEAPQPLPQCDVCNAPCCDLRVNNALLCDAHFDAWLALPRVPDYQSPHGNGVGAHAQMADFVAECHRQKKLAVVK